MLAVSPGQSRVQCYHSDRAVTWPAALPVTIPSPVQHQQSNTTTTPAPLPAPPPAVPAAQQPAATSQVEPGHAAARRGGVRRREGWGAGRGEAPGGVQRTCASSILTQSNPTHRSSPPSYGLITQHCASHALNPNPNPTPPQPHAHVPNDCTGCDWVCCCCTAALYGRRHLGGVEGSTQVPVDVEYGSLDFSITQVGKEWEGTGWGSWWQGVSVEEHGLWGGRLWRDGRTEERP